MTARPVAGPPHWGLGGGRRRRRGTGGSDGRGGDGGRGSVYLGDSGDVINYLYEAEAPVAAANGWTNGRSLGATSVSPVRVS